MNMVPNKQLLLNIPFESTKDRKKELFLDNNVQETIRDVYCLTCRNEKCVDLSTKRWLVSTRVKSAKPAATFWIFLLRTKNWHLCCLVVMVHIALQERRVAITKKKNLVHFWRNFSANYSHPHRKRLEWVQIRNKRIRFLLADDLSNIFKFQTIFFGCNLLSTT